jgi:hypothetical protein
LTIAFARPSTGYDLPPRHAKASITVHGQQLASTSSYLSAADLLMSRLFAYLNAHGN